MTAVENPDGTLTVTASHVTVVLQPGEWGKRLLPINPETTTVLPDGQGLVVLDCAVTPELEAEGRANDERRNERQRKGNVR